jgi:glycogen operon protein
VPLILASDEIGNTQFSNNDALCQDNDVGWVKWDGLGCDEDDLTAFLGHLTELRRRVPQLRARRWIEGRRPDGSFGLLWLRPDADEMQEADWIFPKGDSRLCPRTPGTRAAADLYCPECCAGRNLRSSWPKMAEYKG